MELPDSLTTRRAVLGGVGATLAGGGVVYSASNSDSTSTVPQAAQFHSSTETTGFDIELEGHPIMGAMDAPVDMYYWSEYQCPFCRQFEQDTFPDVIENYVQTGDVRVVFIEFPYLGDDSMTAAVMDQCVWRQVRDETPQAYWQWHSTLYNQQGSKESGWASKDSLLEVAEDIENVDASAVDECMETRRDEIESAINEDIDQASQFGIRGTPASVLYNRGTDAAGKIVGAQPYDRFEDAIANVENS